MENYVFRANQRPFTFGHDDTNLIAQVHLILAAFSEDIAIQVRENEIIVHSNGELPSNLRTQIQTAVTAHDPTTARETYRTRRAQYVAAAERARPGRPMPGNPQQAMAEMYEAMVAERELRGAYALTVEAHDVITRESDRQRVLL